MELSKTELNVMGQIAKGNKSINLIARSIKKSNKQVYRAVKKLKKIGFIEYSNKAIEPVKSVYGNLLQQLILEYPSLISPLSNSGISIFTSILEPKCIKEIAIKIGLKKGIIYKKFRIVKNMSLVIKKNKKYSLNEKIWSKLRDFLIELNKYEEITDKRIPASSTIYFKNEKEIIFSNKEELNAALTAFSAYKKYNLRLLLPIYYYYLPNKKLSKREIFKHSLYIVKKDKSIRNLIYIVLFYIKFKKELSKIKDEIVDNINVILKGKNILNYPTLKEIKEKAELYDIRI